MELKNSKIICTTDWQLKKKGRRVKYRILFLIFVIGQCDGMDLSCKQKEKRELDSQEIVFVYGTTTAGKTSIAAKLAEELHAKVLSIDSFVVPKVAYTLFTQRMNPYNICVANEDLFQKSHMKNIKKEAIGELCAAAITAYKQNNIVIIDAPIYKQKHVNFYKGKFEEFGILDVSWVLVYCPISALVKRVIDRNNNSSIIGQRSIVQALYQFSLLYQSQGDGSIDQLSRDDLNFIDQAKIVHEIMQKDIPDLLKGVQKAICPFTFEEIKNLMLKKFSFGSDGVAPINPVIEHDLIVNTGQYDSAVCAQMILKFLLQKS